MPSDNARLRGPGRDTFHLDLEMPDDASLATGILDRDLNTANDGFGPLVEIPIGVKDPAHASVVVVVAICTPVGVPEQDFEADVGHMLAAGRELLVD